MLNAITTLQRGEEAPLFVSMSSYVDPGDLKLLVYDDGWVAAEATFEDLGDLLYKTALECNEYGYKRVKVQYNGKDVAEALFHVTDTIQALVDAQMGNWEIKENQMLFYKVNGQELMRFDLYDKDDKKTTFGVVKRERVE